MLQSEEIGKLRLPQLICQKDTVLQPCFEIDIEFRFEPSEDIFKATVF